MDYQTSKSNAPGWLGVSSRLAAAATSPAFAVATLTLLVIQVQWGLWASQDLPSADEAWALRDGFALAHGAQAAITWWKSPLYRIMYAATASVMQTVEATFYAQRLALTILSVLALYFLLRRLLPGPLAWLGAAWLAVSPVLIDLAFDRTDFLAAAITTWAALAILGGGSGWRDWAALGLAVVSFLFRPEYLLVVAAVAFYAVARELYPRLPFATRTRVSLIAGAAVVGTLAAGLTAVVALRASPVAGNYFMWVFANNRAPIPAEAPFWILYERDYGLDHSITAVISHPTALVRDIFANLGRIVQFSKAATTSTVWASASVRVERWLAAICLLFAVAGWRLRRHCPERWHGYLSHAGSSWLVLACLLPLAASNLVLAPFPVYLLVLIPALFGTSLLLASICLDRIVAVRPIFFPALVAMILVLAPNARAFGGSQPMRHLVGFFAGLPDLGHPITMLGNAGTTVCAYLSTSGKPCLADEWTDGASYARLDTLMQRRAYNYLVVDNTMTYLLSQPTGLKEVITDQDPRWKAVATFGQYSIFAYAPARN